MTWKTIARPGYFGKKRDEIQSGWDKEYGAGNWRLAWELGDYVLERREALQIYEDGYYNHFYFVPKALGHLTAIASDVYDTAPTNVESRFDYDHQETPNNHLHDIAIRRAVMRRGAWFRGDHLVHVRWTESEGFWLNPGKVSFHLMDRIYPGEITNLSGKEIWWDPLTIEDWYQRNKVLQVREK